MREFKTNHYFFNCDFILPSINLCSIYNIGNSVNYYMVPEVPGTTPIS